MLTCSPSQSLAPALDYLFFEQAKSLCVLLVTFLAQLTYSLDEFGGIQGVVKVGLRHIDTKSTRGPPRTTRNQEGDADWCCFLA